MPQVTGKSWARGSFTTGGSSCSMRMARRIFALPLTRRPASTLLTKLGQANQVNIPRTEVRAIARASGLNPRHEFTGLLQVLEKKRLIEQVHETLGARRDDARLAGARGRYV